MCRNNIRYSNKSSLFKNDVKRIFSRIPVYRIENEPVIVNIAFRRIGIKKCESPVPVGNRFHMPFTAFRVRIIKRISGTDGKIAVIVVNHLARNGKSQTRIGTFLIRAGYHLPGHVFFKSFENGRPMVGDGRVIRRNVPEQTDSRIGHRNLKTRNRSSIILGRNKIRTYVIRVINDVIEEFH